MVSQVPRYLPYVHTQQSAADRGSTVTICRSANPSTARRVISTSPTKQNPLGILAKHVHRDFPIVTTYINTNTITRNNNRRYHNYTHASVLVQLGLDLFLEALLLALTVARVRCRALLGLLGSSGSGSGVGEALFLQESCKICIH